VPEKDIISINRFGELVKPRQMFCYIARKHTNKSFSDIGDHIGRDHATILYSARKIKDTIDLYDDVNSDYNQIMALLMVKDIDPLITSLNSLGNAFVQSLKQEFSHAIQALGKQIEHYDVIYQEV
jgi:hypothetical protein